jgi:hypothetical protein
MTCHKCPVWTTIKNGADPGMYGRLNSAMIAELNRTANYRIKRIEIWETRYDDKTEISGPIRARSDTKETMGDG